MRHLYCILFLLLPAVLGAKEAFQVGLPVKCELNKDCFIQNYVDVHRDSDPDNPKDYTCGPLVYKGHKGTDFRVRTNLDLAEGIEVLAVADGVVKAIRNNMEEGHPLGSAAVKGRECGNGLVIDHGEGWETQYCHMKKGSVSVKAGQKVSRGQALGHIGLSGKTQFPHLHLSIRKDGKVVDPFVGEVNKTTKCGVPLQSLWTKAAQSKVLPYQSTGLIGASFTEGIPSQKSVMEGKNRETKLKSSIDKLIFWVYLFGVREGDTEEFIIEDPRGKVIFKKKMKSAKKNKATWLSFVGKKVVPEKQKNFHPQEEEKQYWYSKIFKAMGLEGRKKSRGFLTEGTYKGLYRLIRSNPNGEETVVIEIKREIEIEFT